MRKAAFVLVLVLMVSALPLLAQDTLQLTVPFEFQVGTMVLPAGQYTMISPTDNTLLIRAADANVTRLRVLIREVAAERLAPVSDTERKNEIVFRRADNGRYALHTVRMISMTHAHDIIHVEADKP